MSDTRHSIPTPHTVVLAGAGPRIRITSTKGTRVTVVKGSKIKTFDLGPVADVEFAA